MAYDILIKKYGNVEVNELNGGYTNKMVSIGGSNPKVVAKYLKKGYIKITILGKMK